MTPAEAVREVCNRHSSQAVADAAEVSLTSVYNWRRGAWMPSLAQAALVDELLGAAKLLEAVREYRTRTCAECGDSYLFASRTARSLYCSRQCQTRVANRMKRDEREPVKDARLMTALRRLRVETAARERLREALDGICRACPEGGYVCGNDECPAHGSTRMECVAENCRLRHGKRAA